METQNQLLPIAKIQEIKINKDILLHCFQNVTHFFR